MTYSSDILDPSTIEARNRTGEIRAEREHHPMTHLPLFCVTYSDEGDPHVSVYDMAHDHSALISREGGEVIDLRVQVVASQRSEHDLLTPVTYVTVVYRAERPIHC